MDYQHCVVYCTCPDESTAEQISERLLSDHLAACINVSKQVTSHFVWEGKKSTETEVLLMIKTQRKKLSNLEKCITEHHPYDCPEIIAVPIIFGHQPYLDWVNEAVG